MNVTTQPIAFTAGQFSNQCIRLDLVEIQKINVGRKHAPGDCRHLLDPPPVVRLRLFSFDGYGTSDQLETELNYDTIQTAGLLLSVDLFRVQDSASLPEIAEPLQQGDSFVGDTYVQPLLIDDYQGRKDLLFVMSNLALKRDGNFLLRYRLYDLLSTAAAPQNESNFIAEFHGAPFHVYSGPNFPGFAASTELTKHLARSGAPVKIRRWNETRAGLEGSNQIQ